MLSIRQLWVVIVIFVLSACGGGGTLESGGGSSGGGSGGNTDTYTLSLVMVNSSGQEIRQVTEQQSGTLRATLRRNGQPAANQLIRFTLSGSVGVLTPADGSARTNDSGVAEIRLDAGTEAGAGQVVASFSSGATTTSSAPYVYDVVITSSSAELQVSIVDRDGNLTRNISHTAPGVGLAQLTINGQAAAFRLISFSLNGLGVLNPSNGTAMTDANGFARIDVLAGTEAGASSLSATFGAGEGEVSGDEFVFTTAGDAPVQGDSGDFNLASRLISATTLQDVSEISANSSGQIVALVTDLNNQPVVNKVVSFSSTLGNLKPAIGTALTDSNGRATINISAGTIEGAGSVTAQYEGVSETLGFYTRGDEVDPNQLNAAVDFRILTDCAADFRTTRNPALCTETTSISAEKPGILFIQASRAGTTQPLVQYLVSATTTLGTISPNTGTAITDSNGVALLDILAGRDVGAGEITVSLLNAQRRKAFEIGAANVRIQVSTTPDLSTTKLPAGSTALINVAIINAATEEPYLPPLEVQFSSSCAVAGLAVLDESVFSTGGTAVSTYRANGCQTLDTIVATVIAGGNTVTGSVNIDVSAANVGSIQFVDVSESYLALKGTGGANRTESSVVRFRLLDANGNPVPATTVDFSLSTAVGGIELDPVAAFTNGDGFVQTVVRSGLVPTPVRVIARAQDPNNPIQVQAPSDNLLISTGVADQNSFSLSRSAFNVHALDFDGNEVDVNVFLADHFNNPVPDGTAVNFIAEGGSIEPGCFTENGRCTVKWRSQNPRPFTNEMYKNTILDKCSDRLPCPMGIVKYAPDEDSPVRVELGEAAKALCNDKLCVDGPLGGRATITAYAVGEESFVDRNGNGRFDLGEFVALYDLTEAFTDHNEDGRFASSNNGAAVDCGVTMDSGPCSADNSIGDEFEEFFDFNSDGIFNLEDGKYNGLLCPTALETAGLCTRELRHIFQNQVIVMSGDEAFMRLTYNSSQSDCTTVGFPNSTNVYLNKDPIPAPPSADPQTNIKLRTNIDVGDYICNVSKIDLSDNATGTGLAQLTLYISDIFNNPLPVGSTVEVSADNGVLIGTESYTVPNTTSKIPVRLSFGLTREPDGQGNDKTDGFLTIRVTAPSGLVSTLSVPVKDDR